MFSRLKKNIVKEIYKYFHDGLSEFDIICLKVTDLDHLKEDYVRDRPFLNNILSKTNILK